MFEPRSVISTTLPAVRVTVNLNSYYHLNRSIREHLEITNYQQRTCGVTLFVATAEQILLAEPSFFLSIESVNADLGFPLVDASIQRIDLNTSQLHISI